MSKRILIAEDDLFYRKLLVDTLNRENYELVAAINGTAALHFIIREPFSLIILDYHLPGKHGSDILKALKKKCIDTPVIVITADATIETERKIRSFGPAYLFIKPVNVNDMYNVVAKIIGNGSESRPDKKNFHKQ